MQSRKVLFLRPIKCPTLEYPRTFYPRATKLKVTQQNVFVTQQLTLGTLLTERKNENKERIVERNCPALAS